MIKFMLLTVMVIPVILSIISSPQPAGAQPGDIYHDIVIATRDGGQGLQGDYKFRYVEIQDLETDQMEGGPAKGTIAFSGGAVSGSVLAVENDMLIFNLNGSFSATPEGYNMTINNVPPEHFTLNLSQDGELLMGTRGEVSNGNITQSSIICVRSNAQKIFSDIDIAGTYRFRNLGMYDIEDSFDREAEVCYGNASVGSGQGTLQLTCIDGDLSMESGNLPVTYTLQGNGEVAFYFLGDPSPLFRGQLSSDGNYMITDGGESDGQEVSVALKTSPGRIYSVANLLGTYRCRLFRVRNFSSNTPKAYVGYGTMTFNGAGTFAGSATYFFSSGGQASSGAFSGTYSVSPDGSITMGTTSGGIGPNDVMYGYISKDDGTVVLTRAMNVAVSPKYGSLQVLIEPEGARNAGAQWRRVGTSTWYNSGYVESGIPVGTYNVEFKTVTVWVKPANTAVTVVENQTAGVTGAYAVQGGEVFVDVTPDNAWWSLSGPAGFQGNGVFYAGDWTFNNAPAGSYTWTAQYQLPNYDAPGTETQSLSVGGSIGFHKAWTQTPPVAIFSATPTEGIGPLTVNFTDLSTGTIHTRIWDFGDCGTVMNQTNPAHIYQTPGTYQATLTVAGPLQSEPSQNAVHTIQIAVDYPPPSAKFSLDRSRGEGPLQVNFTDQSTGDITSWNWTFGDGETSPEQNPKHTLNDLGVYTVQLDVTGPGGSSRAEKTVIVYKTLYVNQSDDTCGGKEPCFTSIQAALGSPEQVEMIKVTQGTYQEEIQHTKTHTAIIQGGNDAAFQSTPSSSTVKTLTGTAGTLILENINVGAQ